MTPFLTILLAIYIAINIITIFVTAAILTDRQYTIRLLCLVAFAPVGAIIAVTIYCTFEFIFKINDKLKSSIDWDKKRDF